MSLSRFNSCEGVFADFPEDRRCFASGETLSLPLRFAHYGDEPIAEARVKWALSADGLKLADGSVAAGRQELGAAREIGVAQIAVPTLQKPVRATLQLEVVGSAAFNRYDLWLLPTRGVRSEPTLAVADELAAALKGRYADTLPASRAVEADVVLAPYGSPLASVASVLQTSRCRCGGGAWRLDGLGAQDVSWLCPSNLEQGFRGNGCRAALLHGQSRLRRLALLGYDDGDACQRLFRVRQDDESWRRSMLEFGWTRW